MSTFTVTSRYLCLVENHGKVVAYLSLTTLLLVFLQRLIVSDAQIDWDEEVYFQIARLWRHGAIPYRDIFDIKPPMIYIFYMLTSFGEQIFWTRFVAAFLLIYSAFHTFRVLRRKSYITTDESLFLTAALCVVISIGPGSGTNLESAYIPFELLSFGFLLNKKPWPAGMCAGIVIAVKYTAIIDLLGLGGAYWILTTRDIGRTRCIVTWGSIALAFSALEYGAFYIYFARHGINLLEAIVYRNLTHARSSSMSILSSGSFVLPFALLAVGTTLTIAMLSGFKTKGTCLLYASLPWIGLSLIQACVTRQYFYHYALPVFIPVSIAWAAFTPSRQYFVILAACLFCFECSQIPASLRLKDEYQKNVARYRSLCSLINDNGYVLTHFLAAYRVCNTLTVDRFMMPPFYLEEHFVKVSQSGGLESFRSKFRRGQIAFIVSTPAIWQEVSPVLGGESDRVKLVPDIWE